MVKIIGYGPFQRKIINIVAFLNVSLGLNGGIVQFLIPLVNSELQMTSNDAGILLMTWGLGNLIGSLILGYAADKKGR